MTAKQAAVKKYVVTLSDEERERLNTLIHCGKHRARQFVSAHQLHRTLGVAYNSAWFMAHRIREAMSDKKPEPLGGDGRVIEADETYIGKRETQVPSAQRKGRPYTKGGKSGGAAKRPVVALIERGGKGRAVHMNHVTAANVQKFLFTNADRKSRLHTDESKLYPTLGKQFAEHETVNHSQKEYARGDVTTNSAEGFFAVFKRGMLGIYQHCGEQHLQRYLDEFSFRYSNRSRLGTEDTERALIAIKGAEGKRLTWRRIGEA